MALPPAEIPSSSQIETPSVAAARASWFALALVLIVVVGDGWSGRPIGLRHQLLVLPITVLFLFSLWKLFFNPGTSSRWTPQRALLLCAAFELLSLALFRYEVHHFAVFGYRAAPLAWIMLSALLLLSAGWAFRSPLSPRRVAVALTASYGLGALFAILCFPVNYLRSDMLAVILWADTNLVHHINPYATIFVGDRVYDFPYLPGMLVAYLPFVVAHLDLRFANIVALAVAAIAVYRCARAERRLEVACLLGLFLLDPFLQYRHDLYLQPHWLTLIGAFLLMQRGRWLWGAFVLGLGMAVYQFSWIVLPFVLLNALWRRGWLESLKLVLAAAAGALLLAGPFLRSALSRISSNTVGQWGRFQHAIADPMNLSYWITYAVHPDKLLRLQAVLMTGIFVWCVIKRRCATLEDTLRWTVVALTVFILCNSIVDGYFFLMLLVPMLLYTLVANDWLVSQASSRTEPEGSNL